MVFSDYIFHVEEAHYIYLFIVKRVEQSSFCTIVLGILKPSTEFW